MKSFNLKKFPFKQSDSTDHDDRSFFFQWPVDWFNRLRWLTVYAHDDANILCTHLDINIRIDRRSQRNNRTLLVREARRRKKKNNLGNSHVLYIFFFSLFQLICWLTMNKNVQINFKNNTWRCSMLVLLFISTRVCLISTSWQAYNRFLSKKNKY